MFTVGDLVVGINTDPRTLHAGRLGINWSMIDNWRKVKTITEVRYNNDGTIRYCSLDDQFVYLPSWIELVDKEYEKNTLRNKVILKIKQLDKRFAERKLNGNPF